jgi:hypothetical protein
MRLVSAVSAGFALLATPAFADDAPKPDKSGYTLFNPTPAGAMRDFSPDRPAKSDSPYTVDAGHFQYETDGFVYTYDRYSFGGITTRTYTLPDPTLKLGLLNNVDIELTLAPYIRTTATTRSTGDVTRASGFGDIITLLKVNLFGNDGGDAALALIPYVKFPTAARNLGNNQVEGGVIAPLSLSIPRGFTLVLQTEIDAFKNANDSGKHANFINLVNLSHDIVPRLTGSLEFFTDAVNDRGQSNIYTVDAALAYLVTPNLQLDLGANLGVSKAAPDIQAYFGISQRF